MTKRKIKARKIRRQVTVSPRHKKSTVSKRQSKQSFRLRPLSFKAPKVKLQSVPEASTRDIQKAFKFLQKAGLIKSKGRTSARKQRRAIVRYKKLFTEQAEAVRLTPDAAKKYKKAGERVIGNVIIVDKKKGERVKRKGKKIYKFRRAKGGSITTILIPNSYGDLVDNMKLLKDDPEIVSRLEDGAKLGFRMGSEDVGWNYSRKFLPVNGRGVDQVFADMRAYIARGESVKKKNIKGAMELVLVSNDFRRPESEVNRSTTRFARVDRTGRSTSGRSGYSRAEYERRKHTGWYAKNAKATLNRYYKKLRKQRGR